MTGEKVDVELVACPPGAVSPEWEVVCRATRKFCTRKCGRQLLTHYGDVAVKALVTSLADKAFKEAAGKFACTACRKSFLGRADFMAHIRMHRQPKAPTPQVVPKKAVKGRKGLRRGKRGVTK